MGIHFVVNAYLLFMIERIKKLHVHFVDKQSQQYLKLSGKINCQLKPEYKCKAKYDNIMQDLMTIGHLLEELCNSLMS